MADWSTGSCRVCDGEYEKKMNELWGIDDATVLKDIQHECHKRLGFTGRDLFGIVILSLGMGGVAGVVDLMGLGGWRKFPVFFCAAMVTTWFTQAHRRRRARLVLADVLRARGRCTNCGYAMCGNAGKTCPECGQEFERPPCTLHETNPNGGLPIDSPADGEGQ